MDIVPRPTGRPLDPESRGPVPRDSRRAPTLRRPLPALVAVALAFAACGGDDGGGPTPPEPMTGTVEVAAATTGDTLDADGYALTLDGGDERTLDPDGTVTFEEVEEGDHDLEISGVQANCGPDGGATRTVSVTAGQTTSTAFDVACDAALFDRIVFQSDRTGTTLLYSVAPDGTGTTEISPEFADFPALSPDATTIAFSAVDRIWLMGADGSDRRSITDATCNHRFADFGPGGERVAFSSCRSGVGDIWMVDVDDENLVQLTSDPAFDRGPTWSPDGDRIAFTSDRSGNDRIWVVEVDGGATTQLTSSTATIGAGSPAWSPDGSKIAFSTVDIWVMNADGSDATRLTTSSALDLEPTWSPDGSRIAFVSDRDGDREIFLMNADGGGVTPVTDDPATDSWPDWSAARHDAP